MRGFEGDFSGHASGSQIRLRVEQYEYCDHSPAGLFVHQVLDFESLELINSGVFVKRTSECIKIGQFPAVVGG